MDNSEYGIVFQSNGQIMTISTDAFSYITVKGVGMFTAKQGTVSVNVPPVAVYLKSARTGNGRWFALLERTGKQCTYVSHPTPKQPDLRMTFESLAEYKGEEQ